MVDGWSKIPILVWVDQIVDELGLKTFIKVIMNSLMKGQGLSREDNALPSSLIDSNVNLWWKQWKSKELGTHSLARNILKG
jgi:hypothetical protein